MKKAYLVILVCVVNVYFASGQAKLPDSTSSPASKEEQEILSISKTKWTWMSDKNVDALSGLFANKSVFVHMGGSWGKDQELAVIKSGNIWYKETIVYSASVNFIGNTAILLNDIDLVAVVGGNQLVNPFMVTEVYIKENNKWKMGSLTFSRLIRPVKMKASNSSEN